ncbi:phosphatase [Bordetella ansorpii]|uniref:Phosphatase n=2 Tax=Bordetella ansorpii TaxID=288768 RepID=A0A157S5I5_9BORD|nr:phosphatase [Bordetella ansorpii]
MVGQRSAPILSQSDFDMPETTSSSRRRALKLLAGAPLLPVGAFGAAPAWAAPKGATLTSARFVPMAAPTLAKPEEMATTLVRSALEIAYSDGSKQTYQLGYESFFTTGDQVPDGHGGQTLAGGYYDIHNKPIMDTSGPTPRQFYSDCPDGSSLIRLARPAVKGVKGNTVFAVVQFEYTTRNLKGDEMYGRLPSPIAVLTLDQDPKTGALTLVKYHNVDTSKVKGLWITCGASLSPWNTHLSSEEYEPDGAKPGSAQLKAFGANLYGTADHAANPYDYGHLPEVTVHPDGTGSIEKHYCLGRISHELIQVMPDQRTALMGDDATNGGLFMFVADKAADLSAGTLYVARYTQTSSQGVGAGTMQWIRLGHATSDEIRALAAKLTIGDIMDVAIQDPNDASYTAIHYNGQPNWIRIKPNMEKAAAFLETHRYAACVGASMALTKNEGTTVNIKDKIAYSALANVVDSMVKGGRGWYEGSGIALDRKLQAGGILAHKMQGGQKDTKGQPIRSDWVPTVSSTLLTGKDIAADELGNTAHPDHIASPDNLKFSEKLRTLFIGEDSGNHVNNFLWAYNVDTKELSRILSTPAGAESTGLHAVDEINGWTYIMSNFQHAGDWDKKGFHDKVKDKLDPLVKANYKDRYGASVGYITGVDLRARGT